MSSNTMNGGSLAYLGDAVWTLLVRKYLVDKGYNRPDDLQKLSVKYVSAKSQATIFTNLLEKSFFTSEEIEIYKRGRNYKSGTVPKNTDVQIYRVSTGFEAIIGYWYVENKNDRIEQLWEKVKTTMED